MKRIVFLSDAFVCLWLGINAVALVVTGGTPVDHVSFGVVTALVAFRLFLRVLGEYRGWVKWEVP